MPKVVRKFEEEFTLLLEHKEKLALKIRSGLNKAKQLADLDTRRTLRWYAVRQTDVQKGVLGLWMMNFWPHQIVKFNRDTDLTEEMVYSILRDNSLRCKMMLLVL
jgi:hypothetical protein